MSLNELIQMSNFYGANHEFVLAGGGNTSYKENGILYIKGSGVSLADITEDGFVKMDLKSLEQMWDKDYGGDISLSEKLVLRDMTFAKMLGEEHKRPSVETLLHQMLPFKLVLHTHPALVNGLTCGRDGEKMAAKLFGNTALFMRATKPGYILAKAARAEVERFKEKNGFVPQVIFMQNHGVFFGADSLSQMNSVVDKTMSTLKKAAVKEADFTDKTDKADIDSAVKTAVYLRTAYKMSEGISSCNFKVNNQILEFIRDKNSFEKYLAKPFTPDHIVYCKHLPLYIEGGLSASEIKGALLGYKKTYGFSPKIALVKGLGMFSLGKTKKEADIAAEVFLDAVKIAVYCQSFGGPLFMTDDDVNFILNWEVENYRQKVSLSGKSLRLSSKIAFVTGAAQGYGKGLAKKLASEGAVVTVADLNLDGAMQTAAEIESEYGKGSAFAVKADVSSEDDVKSAIDKSVLNFGGLDILINNAGIVRAGSLDEMQLGDFRLVTKINYDAYFICSKFSSKIMKLQFEVDENSYSDIIQINSKSGLSGSNKNFAYAGSKFGGIGLTQSFALELIPYKIKVNSICPGNFFDGPLWMDEKNGLFVQYLNAGKVKGAKTVADVKAAYEAKIPLGRGCNVEDVARAVYYIVEQDYETGQAVPVTGGQEMLK